MLSLNLRVAFCREICLLLGLCDVDRPTLLARLRQGPGSAVFLAVGGAAEALLTKVERGRACMGAIEGAERAWELQQGWESSLRTQAMVPPSYATHPPHPPTHPPPASPAAWTWSCSSAAALCEWRSRRVQTWCR